MIRRTMSIRQVNASAQQDWVPVMGRGRGVIPCRTWWPQRFAAHAVAQRQAASPRWGVPLLYGLFVFVGVRVESLRDLICMIAG
jgi:hypothetical protein